MNRKISSLFFNALIEGVVEKQKGPLNSPFLLRAVNRGSLRNLKALRR